MGWLGDKIRGYVIGRLGEEEVARRMSERVVYSLAEGVAAYRDGFATEFAKGGRVNYKPKYSTAMIVIIIQFVAFGLLMTWVNLRHGMSSSDSLFPLVFTVFGVWMAVDYFRKSYAIDSRELYVHSGSRAYRIPYGSIVGVERTRINMAFKHGRAGRIRAETSSHVLMITFAEQGRERVIMVSPAERDLFANHLLSKIEETGK